MADERDAVHRPARTAGARALVGGLLAFLAVVSLANAATPVRAADPAPNTGASATASPSAAPTPIVTSVNLYRTDAAVHQYTIYWCVPASTQIMLNVILHRTDRSQATQTRLARLVLTNNRYKYTVPGNDIRGWAKVLNQYIPASAGVRYRDRAFRTQSAALWEIVNSIDRTGYPVGITVWHGSHAWTVMGYRTRQLPGKPSSRAILGFYVTGPLRTSRYADPYPVRYMSLGTFVTNFTWYSEDRKRAPWHHAFVMVRPEPVLTTPGW